MSIERQLRRTTKGVATDPYWTSVSALVLTTNSTIATQRAGIIDESNTVTSFTMGGNYTYSGGPGFSKLSPFTGKQGSYYSDGLLGGSGIGLPTGLDSQLNFTGDFTVEMWVMVPSSLTNSFYASAIINADNAGFFASGPSVNWTAQSFGGAMSYAISSTIPSNDGVWRHLALVRSGTGTNNLKFYINGALIGSASVGSNNTRYSGSNLCCGIGTGPGAGDNQYVGYMCNVRISNIARYTSAFTSPTDYFTTDANTKFLFTGKKYSFYDASNNSLPVIQVPPPTNNNIIQDNALTHFGNNTIKSPSSSAGVNVLGLPTAGTSALTSTLLNMPGDFTWECFVYIPIGTIQNTTSYVFYSNALKVYSNHPQGTAVNNFSFHFNNDAVFYASSISSVTSEWIHLAVVRSGSLFRIYLNGLRGFGQTLTDGLNFNAFRFMGYNSGGEAYIGSTDQLRITKGVARYTSNFTVPTQAFPTS